MNEKKAVGECSTTNEKEEESVTVAFSWSGTCRVSGLPTSVVFVK